MKMSWLFNSKPTEYGDTPEWYLKLTKRCMDRAQKLTSTSLSISPKFNYGLCKYLAEKLNLAVKNAESYLKLCFPSLESPTTNCLEIFQLLYALSKRVLNFIQSCCSDAWIQAALTLTDVSEHISSIGFDLELWTLVTNDHSKDLRERRCWVLTRIENIFKGEAETVKEIASFDRETMVGKLHALLQTKKPTNKQHQLAALLLERLERPRMIPAEGLISGCSQPTLSEISVKSLKQLESLGRGSAATVYRAKWLGVEVAKKTFYVPDFPDFEKEVSILVGLSHPNITSLLCYAADERECSIVMELMDADLFNLIQRRMQSESKARGVPFGLLEAMDLMLQIASGMQYLHEMRIVHRDLKSMNILVRCVKASGSEVEYVLAKVADFGLSKTKERSMTYSSQSLNLGTTRWMAPELIKIGTDGEAQGVVVKFPFKSDVYSFAMVCYEILTGHQPFANTSSPNEVKRMVLDGDRPQLPDQCPALLKTLIERCWSPDSFLRPCFGDISAELRHLKCALLFHEAQVSNLPTRQEFDRPVSQLGPSGKASSIPRQESARLKTVSCSPSPGLPGSHPQATSRAWRPAPRKIPPQPDDAMSSAILLSSSARSPRTLLQAFRSSVESLVSGSSRGSSRGSSTSHSGSTSMYNSWQGDGSAPPWQAHNSPPVTSGRSTPTRISRHSSTNGMERYVSTVESPQSGTPPVAGTPSKWQKGKLLGSGTFGNVYVGFNHDNGSFCAMKEVLLVSDDHMSKEISLLSKLRHENIVQYIGTETLEDRLYIYLEYVSGGSVHQLLQDHGTFREPVVRNFTRQILSGLSYLHSQNTVHRDIKGANILVDTNGVVKLADFGMAERIISQPFFNSLKGSPNWMAPEVIKQTGSYAVDIWSLGCTVIEMATTKPPWHQYERTAIITYKILNSKELPIIPETLSTEGKEFVQLCLQRDPARRPTAAQLLQHPFVQDCQLQQGYHQNAASNVGGCKAKPQPRRVHQVYSGMSTPVMSSGASTPPGEEYASSS